MIASCCVNLRFGKIYHVSYRVAFGKWNQGQFRVNWNLGSHFMWFSSKVNSTITSLNRNACTNPSWFTKADGKKYEKNFRKSFELPLLILSLYSLTEYFKKLTLFVCFTRQEFPILLFAFILWIITILSFRFNQNNPHPL